MNLQVLKKSRHVPKPGDVFVMKPPDGPFLYGRVVADDANPLGVGGGILIYVYRARSDEKNSVPPLLRDDLLTGPMITNKRPWTQGFFEHVTHRPLEPSDRLEQHCFEDFGRYRDEYGNSLDGPTPPVGQWGLHSYRTIDDEISKALGIALAPDDE